MTQEELNEDALKTIFEAETEEVQEEEKHEEQPQEVEEQPQEITTEETPEETQELNPVDPAFQKVIAKSVTGIYNKGVPYGYNMFFPEKLKSKTLFDLKEEKDELKILESCFFVIIKRAMEKMELTQENEIGIALFTIIGVTAAKLATAQKIAVGPRPPHTQDNININGFEVNQVVKAKAETRGRKKKVKNE